MSPLETIYLGTTDIFRGAYFYCGGELSDVRLLKNRQMYCHTSRTYDAAGNMTSVTDPEGNTIEFAYDPMGNALTKVKGVTPLIIHLI